MSDSTTFVLVAAGSVSVSTLVLSARAAPPSDTVPCAVTVHCSSQLVKSSTLKVYPGLPPGMCSTHKDRINADLLAFLQT